MFSAFCKLRQAVARIASADPETQMLGMGLLSLWNDPPPPDNNVTLTVN